MRSHVIHHVFDPRLLSHVASRDVPHAEYLVSVARHASHHVLNLRFLSKMAFDDVASIVYTWPRFQPRHPPRLEPSFVELHGVL
jgi:hypothetical protein